MIITFVNHTSHPIPRTFIQRWMDSLYRVLPVSGQELVIVYVDEKSMQKLNRQYRHKNTPTDILSFEGSGKVIGELVLCPSVLKKQAKEHGLLFRHELGYYLLHGWLHLLGYEHEGTSKEAVKKAQKMFRLQDRVFEELKKQLG